MWLLESFGKLKLEQLNYSNDVCLESFFFLGIYFIYYISDSILLYMNRELNV